MTCYRWVGITVEKSYQFKRSNMQKIDDQITITKLALLLNYKGRHG